MRSVRTLVVQGWRGRLSLEGLEGLRELKVRDLWIDAGELGRIPGLEKLTSNDLRLGPVLQHPTLHEVDLRGAKIHDWTEVSAVVEQTTLQRLILVDARTPDGDELAPQRSSPVVLHTPLDELRAAVECATRTIAREYHELCGVWSSRPAPRRLTTASPILQLAVLRLLLVDARDDLGPIVSCDLPVVEVHGGSRFPLTFAVADDCRSLGSYRWRGGVTVTEKSAKLLCAWLGREAPSTFSPHQGVE